MTQDASNSRAVPARPLARVEAWEDRSAWALFAASAIFFALSTWLLLEPGMPAWERNLMSFAVVALWLIFVLDYLIRLGLARGARGPFFRSRLFDLSSLFLPFLRPFLILVYIWRLPAFRHGSGATQRARYLTTMVLFSLMFVYTASLGVWLAERDAPGATIVNFNDALWWGFTTIATVGYGDFVPITTLGRILAIGLMMGGIAVIGVTSATLISALTEHARKRVAEDEER